MAELRQRRGCGHAEGPEAPRRSQRGSGECGEHDHGHNTGTRALEGGGSRLGGGAVLLWGAIAHNRGQARENRGGGRLVTSREGSGTLERRREHDEASGRWRRSCCSAKRRAGERGLRKIEGEGANRGVSWVASDEAKLTEATDTARARRRPQNEHETTVDSGDVFVGVRTA
jgi:hypothetical protein